MESKDGGRATRTWAQRIDRARAWLKRVNESAPAIRITRSARGAVPGDLPVLDVSVPDASRSGRLAQFIEGAGGSEPTALKELGLTAVQLWRALPKNRNESHDPQFVTILFTDLVGFSSWALQAGDERALELIRQVTSATTAVVTERRGRVVKTLGDGVMAVFVDGADAIEAAHEACVAVSAIVVDGYRPQLRAGLHTGSPRRDGDDYLGVDVNIAARVADAASAGEVLATSETLAITREGKYVTRRRRFRAKGAPRDLMVYSVVPRYDG